MSIRPKPATSSVDGEALRDRLRDIAVATPQAIDALEPALRAILDATKAAGGAICLYDQRREMLRLAAEAGLSDEGCRRLRTVRRGDAANWDMPLHGLLNRRAYLIESAAQNRYVPSLVEAAPVRAVVCLPMYADSIPVGSLVLVVVAPHSLREPDIRKLEPSLGELGRLIEAVRTQASAAPSTAPGEVSGPLGGDEAHPGTKESAAPEPGASPALSLGTAALAPLQRENARLERELERLRARAASDEATTAEIDRLRARLAEAEAGAAHEQRVREELEAARARGASTGQQEVREAQQAARRAEAARGALAAENSRLAAEVERLRAGIPGGEPASPDVLAEIDRLRARLAEAEAGAAHEQRAREELEAALGRGASAGQHEVREAHEATRRAEAARAAQAAETARLAAELEGLRATVTGGDARVPELFAEIDRLRARLAEAEAGAAHEHRAREELEAALERGASVGRDELGRALEQARQAETARATLAGDNLRLTTELEWARHEVIRIEPLAAALAQAQDEQARLAAALDAAVAERTEAAHSHAVLEAESAAAHAAEVERLQARLAEVETVAERERPSREALEARTGDGVAEAAGDLREALEATRVAEEARDAARAELETARVEVARRDAALGTLRDEVAEARRERAASQAHERETRAARQAIARELEEGRAREADLGARFAERERELAHVREEYAAEITASAAREERLAAEGETLRATVTGLEVERDRLAAEVEGAAAARARLEEALEQGLEEARARERELDARLAERERELAHVREEYATEITGSAAREERLAAEGETLQATVTGLEVERDRLAAEVEGAAAARARLEEALERGLEEARGREQELGARLAGRERALGQLRTDWAADATRVEALAAEGEALRATVTGLEVERDRLAAEVEGAAAARARLEEALERGLEEARAREQDLGTRLAERERALERLHAERAPGLAPAQLAAIAERPEAAEASRPNGAPRPTAAKHPFADVGSSTVAVLDADREWEAIGWEGELVVIAPEDDIAARLAGLRPAHVLINLACPRALGALAALYAAGPPPGFRVSACIGDTTQGRALPLGAIELAARPLDPDAILGLLERHATRGTRIVTVGEDIDAFVSLRQALTRERRSVSMAWNAKQASELLPMVRPAAVVVDLALPPADHSAVIAQLAALDPIPTAVLVMGNGDCASNFASVLGDATNGPRMRPLADVLARILRGG